MKHSTRWSLTVLVAGIVVQTGWAADKPAAQLDDARRAALLKAGYTAVPLVQHTFGPGGGATLLAVECRVGAETAELWPRLEGKWVGVSVECDGQKWGKRDAARATIEFKDDRIRFSAPGIEADWATHIQDEGRQYRFAFFDREVKETDVNFGYAGGGIFKLSDDGKLKLNLFTDPSKKGEAVYTFDAPKRSGRILIEFERAK